MTQELTAPQVILQPDTYTGELPRDRFTPRSLYKRIREIRRDPTVALARQLCIAPILAARWSVEEMDGAPPGARDLIEEMFMPMRIHLLRSAFYGCIDFGWQSYEKVVEISPEGLARFKKFKPLLPDITSILVDPDTGAFIGLRQDNIRAGTLQISDTYLDVSQCLLLNIDVEGTNWYGESVTSMLVPLMDKYETVEKAADRYDRKIAGAHWVIHYPMGTTKLNGVETDNATVATAIVSKLESSGAIIVPRQLQQIIDDFNKQTASEEAWKIELLNDPGGGAAFGERLKYLDSLKVRAFGMPERSLLEGTFGTKAEAEAHANIAILNMELRHQLIVQQLNWHAVNQILRWNYGEEAEDSVYIEPAPIADLEKTYLRDLFKLLLGDPTMLAGEIATWDMEAFRDRLGIPSKPEADLAGNIADVTAADLMTAEVAYDPYGSPLEIYDYAQLGDAAFEAAYG